MTKAGRQVWSGMLAAAVLSAALLGGASAVAVASYVPVCQAAADLVDAGKPQQALALIDQVRWTPPTPAPTTSPVAADAEDQTCAAQRAEALAAVAGAQLLMRERVQAVADFATLDPEEQERTRPEHEKTIAALAEDALELDADNADAQAATSDQPASTWSQRVQKSWDGFVKDDARPLQSVALAFLATLAVLVAVGRLGATLPVRWPVISLAEQRAIALGGLAAAVVGAAALVGPRAGLRNPNLDPRLALTIAVVICLLGVAALAVAIATRLRMSVEAMKDDKTDEAATSHIVALLADLGGSRPRGLEVPRGSDVQALDGSRIGAVPAGKVVGAVFDLLRQLLGDTPWRVRIDAEGEDTLAVVITRNGRSVDSAIISRTVLQLPETVDLHRFAAAAILITLSRHHQGFEGLAGARDWRGLGLHYVATTDLRDEVEAAAALGRAVDWDPDNWLAQVAFRHNLDRYSDDAERLEQYADWLTSALEHLQVAGRSALRQRALFARAVAYVNHYFARGIGGPVSPSAVSACEQMILALADGQPGDAELKRDARPCAAAVALWTLSMISVSLPPSLVRVKAQAEEWMELPTGPLGSYNRACLEATKPTPDVGAAIRHLRLATTEPTLKDWMGKDPQLNELRKDKAFRTEFNPKPSSDLLELAPLRPSAKTLRRAGLTSPNQITESAKHAKGLRAYLAEDPVVIDEVIRIGRLAESVPENLTEYRVELCRELMSRGKQGIVDARLPLGNKASALAADVQASIAARCSTAPNSADVEAWLRSLWLRRWRGL